MPTKISGDIFGRSYVSIRQQPETVDEELLENRTIFFLLGANQPYTFDSQRT